MTRAPRVVALIGKYKSPQVAAPLLELSAYLRGRGIEVVIDRLTAQHVGPNGHRVLALEEIGRHADLAVVIGGDGTMLNIARMLAPFGVPLIGVNQGRLGFLTDLSADSMIDAIAALIDGEAIEERRTLLEAEVEAGERGPFRALAFNDVVVSKGTRSGMVEFDVTIDGRFVYTLRSDGLIMTTPTGSTAYALSSGGPILHPALSAIGLVPISPHTLSNRPIVLPGDAVIELRLQRSGEGVVRCDSHSDHELRGGDTVRVRTARHSVRLLHPTGHDYYAMLREKLRWSESPVSLRSSTGPRGRLPMLRSLLIRDFVIVDRLDIELASGFTALTGETGAGKSILVDALGLALGDRADSTLVRPGAARAEIAATFEASPHGPLAAWLREQALDDDADARACLLRRVIEAGGRSRAWINGRPATLAQLRDAGEQLVDIHGQHAHQSLARGAAQRALLDGYGGLDDAAARVAEAHRAWREARAAREAAERDAERLASEREELSRQVAELQRLAPSAGEWARLAADHARVANAAALLEATGAAVEALADGDDTLLARVRALTARLGPLADLDTALRESVALLEAAAVELQEAAHGLRRYRDHVEIDPARLRELDDRMAALHAAARRWRCAPDDLAAWRHDLEARLAAAEAGADVGSLARAEAARAAEYERLARALGEARARAARAFEQAVTGSMQALAMEGGRFEVALIALAEGTAAGLEEVEFRVAPHEGLPAVPVARTASGGELSRLALAIQAAASEAARVPTLVFDEIDTGIGGRVAAVVGRMLAALGTRHQVLCVTHLPQVAAAAAHQFRVSKRSAAGGVTSAIEPIAGEARVEEIARMLGGARVTEAARRAAAELLGARR